MPSELILNDYSKFNFQEIIELQQLKHRNDLTQACVFLSFFCVCIYLFTRVMPK